MLNQVRKFSKFYDDWRLSELVNSFLQRSTALLEKAGYAPEADSLSNLMRLCRMLISTRGEAFGIAAANEALGIYAELDEESRLAFFAALGAEFLVDPEALQKAAAAFAGNPGKNELKTLSTAIRPKLRTLIERLNEAPGATIALVRMRGELLRACAKQPELRAVDEIFADVFTSWFNKGFLTLRRIDWDTPAEILEKIIQYEAVHELQGWEDLRSRILPGDRCLYAFFHPRLDNEPLIFVEVALSTDIPSSIQEVLKPGRTPLPSEKARVAAFYSISNCQNGLRGIPLGSFLIKQVVADLQLQFPDLDTFVTLSPVPGFAAWLKGAVENGTVSLPESCTSWNDLTNAAAANKPEGDLVQFLQACCAHFLRNIKDRSGRPSDPVAKFHLGNGACLERVNISADTSQKGLDQSLGVMVNYLYSFREIEQNHENFANNGAIATSRQVARLASNAKIYTEEDTEERRQLLPAQSQADSGRESA